MAKFTVGCVPYINAIPLVEPFENLGPTSPIEVIYNVPSRLPELLNNGDVQAVLVSSFDALTQAGRRIAWGICIGSRGAVESVRLFSKKDPRDIKTLALDQSSMTSNALAQIILSERYGVNATTVHLKPDLNEMLASCDAAVLIGDLGLSADGHGLHVLDLGEEWLALTGLPFVWAGWIGNDGLTTELAETLQSALDHGQTENWIERAKSKVRLPDEAIHRYFETTMEYRMDETMLDGLRAFQQKLVLQGFPAHYFPTLIGSPVQVSVL